MKYTFSDTVLIIGAGAHKNYHFPTAAGLKREILSVCVKEVAPVENTWANRKNNSKGVDKFELIKNLKLLEIVSQQEENSEIEKKLDYFARCFAESRTYSIDAYLAKKMRDGENGQMAAIGKLLISYFIRKAEKSIPLGFHGKDDWIEFIINEFLKDEETLKKFLQKPPKIYTFNYDNYFEMSLYGHFRRYHGLKPDDALEAVKRIEICHIYGSLNSIELRDDTEIYANSLENFKVIGEERSGVILDEVSKKIGTSLTEAKEVYFLGFGFDKQNVELLFRHFNSKENILKGREKQTFISTNIRLGAFERKRIQDELQVEKINLNLGSMGSDRDCYKLIREEYPIFSNRDRSEQVQL